MCQKFTYEMWPFGTPSRKNTSWRICQVLAQYLLKVNIEVSSTFLLTNEPREGKNLSEKGRKPIIEFVTHHNVLSEVVAQKKTTPGHRLFNSTSRI